MSEELALLEKVTEDVLEKMFFSAAISVGEPCAGAPGLAASVAFDGARSGALVICATEETAERLAQSFLAQQDVPDSEVAATFGELANVLCGSLLGHLQPSGRFLISAPKLSRDAAPETALAGMTLQRLFELEEGALEIGFGIQ